MHLRCAVDQGYNGECFLLQKHTSSVSIQWVNKRTVLLSGCQTKEHIFTKLGLFFVISLSLLLELHKKEV